MATFAELLAAHRADATTDVLAPITDVAHVASLMTEGLDAYEAAGTPDDKAVIGPFVQSINAHREGLLSKAAAAKALDDTMAGLRTAVVTPAETPEPKVAAAVPAVTPGTLSAPATDAPVGTGAPAPAAKVAAFQAAANTDEPVGAELSDGQLGNLLDEAAKHVSGDNGYVKVASLRYIDEAAPYLSNENPAGVNTAILKAQTAALKERNAKTAAANSYAGFAGPAEYNRAIPFASVTDRPLLSAMRRVPIKTTIKHYRSAGLSSTSSGATVWTVTNQQSLDPADGGTTWKPVSVLTGDNTEVTVTPYAVWGGLEFDTFQEMSAPERVDEAKKLLGANLARAAEKQMLDTLITLGGTYGSSTAPVKTQIGAYKGFFEILETIATDAGYLQRMMTDGWRVAFPYGFERVMSIDKRNGQFGDSGMGKSDIDAELRKIGFGAGVYTLDDPTIAATRPLAVPFVGGSSTMSITTANTSTDVTVASTATLQAGMTITGTGVPAAATVSSITSATVFVLSAAATATGTVTGTFRNAATQFKPLGLRKWPITIFDPASVFAGQRGILSAAVETDATLNRQNRKRYRLEDMEAVGRDGVNAPITLWVQLAPSGTAAADITYDPAQADFSTT